MSQGAERTWSPGSLSGDIRSHPDRLLRDHLDGTYLLMSDISAYHGLEDIVPDDVLEAAGITHDLGKCHKLFQEHLDGKGEGVDHSLPSAWFTLDMAEKYRDSEETPLIWIMESVRRHHTHMDDASSAAGFWEAYTPEQYLERCGMMKKLVPSWTEFMTAEEWEGYADALFMNDESFINEKTWLFYRLLYSLLVTADRMDAVGIRSLKMDNIPVLKMPDFSSDKASPLNDWRSEVHNLCMKAAEKINKPGLFTLTLPTGAGKTITGLDIAHSMAEKWHGRTIIYAMPFISIIEQNSSVAKGLFGKENVQEDHSKGYIRVTEGNSKTPWSRMQNIFRYWRSPVVLTTMVQLWEAIYSPRANDSMDFHRLSNAVVIMDEPQTVNPRYWKGFGKTLQFLSDRLGTTFILMTATQPSSEIAPQTIEFPYNRHGYTVLPGKHGLESLPGLIAKHIDDFPDGSGLMVLNTRVSALQVYRMLKDKLPGPVLFLSTWMVPRHRRKIMEVLKYLEEKKIKHYLVSTQAVEAGVDLDFDWVFRDMGPLDSIIQVAGRCNRHCRKQKQGKVLVAELQTEKGRSYCNMVYDDLLLDSSRRYLQLPDSVNTFDESSVKSIVKEYYASLDDVLGKEPV